MNSPDVVGATLVEPSPEGLVILLDDGTRRTVAAGRAPQGALRTGQRLQVRILPDEGLEAVWPHFEVMVSPRS